MAILRMHMRESTVRALLDVPKRAMYRALQPRLRAPNVALPLSARARENRTRRGGPLAQSDGRCPPEVVRNIQKPARLLHRIFLEGSQSCWIAASCVSPRKVARVSRVCAQVELIILQSS